MMNDLKTGMKVIRYAYGIRTNCIQAGAFALSGLLLVVAGEHGNFGLMGGFFWISIGILPTQLIHTLNVANFVQASPMKKKMQTIIPTMVNLISMTVVYLVEILVCGMAVWGNPEQSAQMGGSLITLTLMMVFVLLYLGVCYKYFVAATICLVPVMVFWMRGGLDSWMYSGIFFERWDMSFGMAVLVGFGILMVGGAAEYLLTLLFYKKPMSKMAQAVPLRKEL